jgi:hypothetical protein
MSDWMIVSMRIRFMCLMIVSDRNIFLSRLNPFEVSREGSCSESFRFRFFPDYIEVICYVYVFLTLTGLLINIFFRPLLVRYAHLSGALDRFRYEPEP